MKQQLFGETIPSVVKDPFDAKYIETISMRCSRGIFSGVYEFSGYVEFKNEKTEGKQKFTASNLGELYMKIMEFCKSLEKY